MDLGAISKAVMEQGRQEESCKGYIYISTYIFFNGHHCPNPRGHANPFLVLDFLSVSEVH